MRGVLVATVLIRTRTLTRVCPVVAKQIPCPVLPCMCARACGGKWRKVAESSGGWRMVTDGGGWWRWVAVVGGGWRWLAVGGDG